MTQIRSSRQLFSTVFGSDARKYPVIGHLELFNQITREDMIHYHRTHYTTENAFLCVSGDFDTEEMLKLLEQLNASISRSFTHPVEVATEPVQQGFRQVSSSRCACRQDVSGMAGTKLGPSRCSCTRSGRPFSGRSSTSTKSCVKSGTLPYVEPGVTFPVGHPGGLRVLELEPSQIAAMEQAVRLR